MGTGSAPCSEGRQRTLPRSAGFFGCLVSFCTPPPAASSPLVWVLTELRLAVAAGLLLRRSKVQPHAAATGGETAEASLCANAGRLEAMPLTFDSIGGA